MKRLSRISLIFIIIISTIGILVLLAPQYLRSSLIHWYANIDDYSIFENRIVDAGTPDEWAVDDNYNNYQISREDRNYLESHQSVAFLVIQNDSILYEEYWDDYNAQSYSNIFSSTKSIVSLLVGIAIDEGKIESLNEPIGKYLPEFANDKRGQITIKNLLTMSSGLDWKEQYSNPWSITTKSYYGNKLRQTVMDQSLIEEPGIRFEYQSGNTQLLSFIIEEATNKTIADYASQKLWIPMGAKEDALWSLDNKNGDEKSFCCFNTNARDLARFGQLLLNKGMWNGKRIVSESYLLQATQAASYLWNEKKNKKVDFYGYQYWILNHRGMNIPYMRGHRGQYVYTIPEKNAVVVRLGRMKDRQKSGPNTMDIPKYIEIALKILK